MRTNTLIRVHRTTVDRVKRLKIVERETQDEVINRALSALEEVNERRDQADQDVRRRAG